MLSNKTVNIFLSFIFRNHPAQEALYGNACYSCDARFESWTIGYFVTCPVSNQPIYCFSNFKIWFSINFLWFITSQNKNILVLLSIQTSLYPKHNDIVWQASRAGVFNVRSARLPIIYKYPTNVCVIFPPSTFNPLKAAANCIQNGRMVHFSPKFLTSNWYCYIWIQHIKCIEMSTN